MLRAVTLLSLGLCSLAAQALDYASVGAETAVLFDAPSAQARKLFVVSRYLPLERVVTLKDWVKVRDASGGLAWIARADLSDARYVVVTADTATVRVAAQNDARVVYQARKDVALELLEPPRAGWLHVRHADGATGYLRGTEVWGD